MEQIRIFSPATVANVSCGFDVLGFCLDSIGDEMVIRKTKTKGVTISKIEGYDLPLDAEKNVAGVAALALLKDAQPDFGFEIEIYKKIKPGSGVGSSAASAAGAVFGINTLLGNPYSLTQLTYFAMHGEALASKSFHADNLAPALFGGFTLVKSVEPLEILELPTPTGLFAVILHPQIEVKTSEARALLPTEIPLKNAITQWANVGSLVHALHTANMSLLKNSLVDVVAEPARQKLISHFAEVKTIALAQGALGTGISGSGPSIFTLCENENQAHKVANAIEAFYKTTQVPFKIYTSKINAKGIKILDN